MACATYHNQEISLKNGTESAATPASPLLNVNDPVFQHPLQLMAMLVAFRKKILYGSSLLSCGLHGQTLQISGIASIIPISGIMVSEVSL
jgi:hypothetical protein